MPTNDLSTALNRPCFGLPSTVALLVALVATLAVVLFGRLPTHARWAADLSDAAHGPALALVTLILIVLLRRTPGRADSALKDYSLAIGSALVLGIGIELLQIATGGDSSVDDVVQDALGALAAVGFYALIDPRIGSLARARALRASLLTIAIASTLLLVAPLGVTGAAYLQRNRQFPTLVDFDSPLSLYFLGVYDGVKVRRAPLPHPLATKAGDDGLQARIFGDSPWSLAVWEPIPDWRPFTRIAVDVANPTDSPLRIRLRIRDDVPHPDRRRGYIGTIEVGPRARVTWLADLSQRPLALYRPSTDLSSIRGLVLSNSPENYAHEFYVMRIWLE